VRIRTVVTGLIAAGFAIQMLAAEEAPPREKLASASPDSNSANRTIATGGLRGITRNPSGLPLPLVKVVVHSAEAGADRTTTSGSDGAFAVEGLKPGHYEITAEKEGFAASPATSVELAAHRISTWIWRSRSCLRTGATAAPAETSSSGLPKLLGRLASLFHPIARCPYRAILRRSPSAVSL